MITFQNTYNNRKKEIEEFLELLDFLEKAESQKQDGISEFSKFFYKEGNGIHMTYQSLINILKSNLSLMIYNIIEFTVSSLIDSIYDEISANHLSYVDVNDSIRTLWRKTILKAVNDPNASFNTFLNKNGEIIDMIINKRDLQLRSRDTLPAGNLDGETINKTFASHGVSIQTSSPNYRPDILESIKNNRNNLGHGQVSFDEAVREDSIGDIKKNEEFVMGFLDELIETVSAYIDAREYYNLDKQKGL